MLNDEVCVARHKGRPFEAAIGAMLAGFLVAGCTTTTIPDYVPRMSSGSVGYSDLQLTPNRYRVSFSGSTASTRDDVERYLLRRAAEVTLQTGHTHFVLADRDTERDTSYYSDHLDGPYYYNHPYRSWYGSYPYWAGNGWSSTTYSAYADVVMMDAEGSARSPQAIDALNLLQRLQPAPNSAVASQRQERLQYRYSNAYELCCRY